MSSEEIDILSLRIYILDFSVWNKFITKVIGSFVLRFASVVYVAKLTNYTVSCTIFLPWIPSLVLKFQYFRPCIAKGIA